MATWRKIVIDLDLQAHVDAADPHTAYQKESEKGVASGYASLGSTGYVPLSQLLIGDSLLTSLVSYWMLNEASGTRADAHGSNDLTDNATVTSAAGKIGNAAQFVAANNEWLDVADNATLQVGALDWTFSVWLWINSTAANLGAMARETGADAASTFALRGGPFNGADRVTLSTISGTTLTSISSPVGSFTAGAWHFVVFGWDEAAKKSWVQVDAGTVTESGVLGTPNAGSRPLTIGRFAESSNGDWDGLIDEVGFWKRKLNSDEVGYLYNSGAGLTYPFRAGVAPSTAKYIVQQADAALAAGQALSALATGYMKVTTATGVITSQAVPIPITDGGTGNIAGAATCLQGYTVATLPTGVAAGRVAYVTDATAPTFLATIAGGGAVVCPVFYDGTNWKAF